MTIEDAKLEYNKIKKSLGRVPTSAEFFKNSIISKRELGKLLTNEAWSKLVRLCGDTPINVIPQKSNINEILTNYGELTRKLGRIPYIIDWDNSGNKPSSVGIKRSHNLKWSEISNKFYQLAKDEPKWKDLIILFSPNTSTIEINKPIKDECFVYLMLDSKNNLYKIGISKTAEFREKTLQSEKPSIKLIAAKKYINRRIAANFEKALHDSYSHKRRRGEWFLLDSEDLYEIKTTLDS